MHAVLTTIKASVFLMPKYTLLFNTKNPRPRFTKILYLPLISKSPWQIWGYFSQVSQSLYVRITMKLITLVLQTFISSWRQLVALTITFILEFQHPSIVYDITVYEKLWIVCTHIVVHIGCTIIIRCKMFMHQMHFSLPYLQAIQQPTLLNF